MGLNFESFNLSWIRKFLELKYPNIGSKLKLQHKVSDSSCTVIDKPNEFVIDIYCPDPLIIAQHTSFLKHYETDKVHKLLRMNDFLMHEKDDGLFFYYCVLIILFLYFFKIIFSFLQITLILNLLAKMPNYSFFVSKLIIEFQIL